MSYYRYMTSSYQSSLPLSRSSYSSSYSSSVASRFNRANSAPPGMYEGSSYYGVMPFNRSLAVIEDTIRSRAASVEPSATYRRAYSSYTPYGATTNFDYKVMDYASKLDREESTRSYINNLRSDYNARNTSLDNPHSTWGSAYNRGASDYRGSSVAYEDRLRNRLNTDAYRYNSRDLYSYKHYRKSNQTLEDRNTRAKSPLMSRELDRYYKTEKRSSYLGDISSGGQNDFRYYNYRHVPYFGGSDYYSLTQQVPRV